MVNYQLTNINMSVGFDHVTASSDTIFWTVEGGNLQQSYVVETSYIM